MGVHSVAREIHEDFITGIELETCFRMEKPSLNRLRWMVLRTVETPLVTTHSLLAYFSFPLCVFFDHGSGRFEMTSGI
jgi:hypothetical protein